MPDKKNGYTPQVYDTENDLWESLDGHHPYPTTAQAVEVLKAYKGKRTTGRILTIKGWISPYWKGN